MPKGEPDSRNGPIALGTPNIEVDDRADTSIVAEPAAVVDQIQQLAARIDLDNLTEEELKHLQDAATGLASLVNVQNDRKRHVESCKALVQGWEAKTSEAIAGDDAVQNNLIRLKKQIEKGTISSETVGTVLNLFEKLISLNTRFRSVHDSLTRAVSETDYRSVRSFNDTLESLDAELSKTRISLDEKLLCPDLVDSQQNKPHKSRITPTNSSETSTKRSSESAINPKPKPDQSPLKQSTKPKLHLDQVVTNVTPTSNDDKELQINSIPSGKEPQQDRQCTQQQRSNLAQPDNDQSQQIRRTNDAITNLITHNRLGLAYHLSLAVPNTFPSAATIKLAAFSYVTDQHAVATDELSELAAKLLQEAEAPADRQSAWSNQIIFLACAALLPALAAPGGSVAQLLDLLDRWLDETPNLRAIVKSAADVSMKGIRLPTDLLYEEDSLERWHTKESRLRSETKSWENSELHATIKFDAATRVWHRMLEDWERDNGQSSLGHMFALLDNSVENIDVNIIENISKYWRDHKEKEIDRIDRELRNRTSKKKIQGPSRSTLRSKIDQALILTDRWLALISEYPTRVPSFYRDEAAKLRAIVQSTVGPAHDEIAAVSNHHTGAAQSLLRRYEALFNRDERSPNGYPVSWADLLHGELLANPDIAFDNNSLPVDSPVHTDALWKLLNLKVSSFGDSAVERAKRGDFLGAFAAINIAERTEKIDAATADRSRTEVENERNKIQSDLNNKIEETSNRLDAAYATGTFTFETYNKHRSLLPQSELSEVTTFQSTSLALDRINKDIITAEEIRQNAIRGSLEKIANLSPQDKERIETAIDTGRCQVAEDYIERIQKGQKLPEIEILNERPFDKFFPDFVDLYTEFCDRLGDGVDHVRQMLKQRASDEFMDVSSLSEDASVDGELLLQAWVELRDNPRTSANKTANKMGELIRALGFARTTVQPTNKKTLGNERVFSLSTLPVSDRRVVQLPEFGSRANGKYRIFAIRGRTTGEAIVSESSMNRSRDGYPNIVLFFRILDSEGRRSLARDFLIEEHQPTIVLDESLIVFLATWPGNRLRALFDCVSPFTASQPYEPDAAELPPEMFFGRNSERKAILGMSDNITHFVYGGRRLGKTTLLANIAREHRISESEQSEELVVLINLKGTGIGENRPTEDLWRIFTEMLPSDVVERATRKADSFGKSIKRWIDSKQGRRILLLVDEADAFLSAESEPEQGYRVLEQIKRLMEESERRFKVVFAGLHNVQRAARDPNTPFAHLGEPVRIGPMLPGSDDEEIHNLIRRPLEALGYRFVSNDSVVRIAAETNYYPALAQQFCRELLKTLREDSVALGNTGPPYPIQPALVDRVFNARETRDRIRNLFKWTIELDTRYDFLTYLIAKSSLDSTNGRPQAVPIVDIRDNALAEWPRGFESDSSFWIFEVLLEEMMGLGILREEANKAYAIRTRNLRVLLGNDDEIERRLSDAKERPTPAVFVRHEYRSTLEDGTLSCLTGDQEKRLLSGRYAVGLVFGTHLSRLGQVDRSLQRAAMNWGESVFIESVSLAELGNATGRALRSRKPGTHVVLTDMRDKWDVKILRTALASVENREWHDRIVRPVLLCGPKDAWRWLYEDKDSVGDIEQIRDIWLGPCGLNFARRWLRDHESKASDDLEKRDIAIDAPWPLVVEVASSQQHIQSINDAVGEMLEDETHRQIARDVIGVSPKVDAVLDLFAEFQDETMTADFLADLLEDKGTLIDPDEVANIVNWANCLGVVHRAKSGYRIDSTYAMLLGRSFCK